MSKERIHFLGHSVYSGDHPTVHLSVYVLPFLPGSSCTRPVIMNRHYLCMSCRSHQALTVSPTILTKTQYTGGAKKSIHIYIFFLS